jgi:hypothetical protein
MPKNVAKNSKLCDKANPEQSKATKSSRFELRDHPQYIVKLQ